MVLHAIFKRRANIASFADKFGKVALQQHQSPWQELVLSLHGTGEFSWQRTREASGSLSWARAPTSPPSCPSVRPSALRAGCSSWVRLNARAGVYTPSCGVLPRSPSCCSGSLLGTFLCGQQPSSLLSKGFINL